MPASALPCGRAVASQPQSRMTTTGGLAIQIRSREGEEGGKTFSFFPCQADQSLQGFAEAWDRCEQSARPAAEGALAGHGHDQVSVQNACQPWPRHG